MAPFESPDDSNPRELVRGRAGRYGNGMSQNPYDYQNRTHVLPISWEDFHALCKGLARAVASFEPEIVLPIGRGGYYPGALIAHMLQVEVYPVRLSRRVADVVTYRRPRWLAPPPQAVEGRRVVVVDEISSTGETLSMVGERVTSMGASAVRCAVLYAHSQGVSTPDYIGLVSDALILNPWDREVFKDGRFRIHPEYLRALEQGGFEADPASLAAAPERQIAKGGS
jgi:hypoxanthine phosphoribosyltransferase